MQKLSNVYCSVTVIEVVSRKFPKKPVKFGLSRILPKRIYFVTVLISYKNRLVRFQCIMFDL